jgi:hypothetical protein
MRRLAICLGIGLLGCAPAFAQGGGGVGWSPVGLWTSLHHEDELERGDPGPPPGDYTGLPINAAARAHGDAWHADLVSVPEHQCIPHNAPYSMRGPANLAIVAEYDKSTGVVVGYTIHGTFGGASRTIWTDGRPHPGRFAPHTWAGFSTGVWEGDTLHVMTTHIKSGYLRRIGINYSEDATYEEFFDLHDKYLAVTTLVYDPVYLTEPLLRTETFAWNPFGPQGPPHAYGAQCVPAPEVPREYGWVPHQLPGKNITVRGFTEAYGVPFEATRGGAETMYPEYKKKVKTMPIGRPVVFENKFKREHEDAAADAKETKK